MFEGQIGWEAMARNVMTRDLNGQVGSTSTPASRLEHVEHSKIDECTLLCVVELGATNHNSVGREIDTPSKCGRAAQHSHGTLAKKLLDKRPIAS